MTRKGAIPLKGAEVFVPKRVKDIKSEFKMNLCIASQEQKDDKKGGGTVQVCTLLAASSEEERDGWVEALQAAVRAAAK